jgi:hypothetical protein
MKMAARSLIKCAISLPPMNDNNARFEHGEGRQRLRFKLQATMVARKTIKPGRRRFPAISVALIQQ